MNKLQTALLGRTTSYRLNAYDDADIADLLVSYVETRQLPEGDGILVKRACDHITGVQEERAIERILVRAYTFKWFNGFANLMWARFQEGLFGLDCLVELAGHYAHEHEHGPVDIFFWVFLLGGNLQPVADFVEAYHPLTLSPRETAEEIIAVQHANTQENKLCHDHILSGEPTPYNPKVGLIQRLAEQQAHPQAFLRAAARTQTAAGKWDAAFTALLRVRF
jgi:hypothetical protein